MRSHSKSPPESKPQRHTELWVRLGTHRLYMQQTPHSQEPSENLLSSPNSLILRERHHNYINVSCAVGYLQTLCRHVMLWEAFGHRVTGVRCLARVAPLQEFLSSGTSFHKHANICSMRLSKENNKLTVMQLLNIFFQCCCPKHTR